MKNAFSIFLALMAWFSVITQFVLMLDNRLTPVGESIIRFFSFFTILTNTLVALYFTSISLGIKSNFLKFTLNPVTLTAITIYITMVGLVFQVLLRHIWQPTGLQLIMDELLHTVIPILVIVYWYLYGRRTTLDYRQIPGWLGYPLLYLVYILVRGALSGFYPYPFIAVNNLGYFQVLVNSLLLILLFGVLSAIFIFVARTTKQN